VNLYIDIETIPDQRHDAKVEIAATIKPPGTLKKAESIAEWVEQSKPAVVEEAWLKTALDGTYGQIVCIGYAADDAEPASLEADDLTPAAEAQLLRRFFSVLSGTGGITSGRRPTLIGHNLITFDLPFIWRRAVIRGIKPPLWWPRNPKPWSDVAADTMLMWAGDRGMIGMDRLCKALGIAGKGDISGADVWPLVQAGKLAEVAAYCRADVQRTRALYQRMTFEPCSV
jgi:3'-5' exonuclease